MLSYEIQFDTYTIMKDILQDLADDHNRSLEKLKDVPQREATNNEAWELPDRTAVQGRLIKKVGKNRKRTWDGGDYYGYYG